MTSDRSLSLTPPNTYGLQNGYLQHPGWSFVTGYPVVRPVCTNIRGGLATIDFVNHISRTRSQDYFEASEVLVLLAKRSAALCRPLQACSYLMAFRQRLKSGCGENL